MSDIQLNDAFFQKTAGWEVVKHARALLAIDKVLSSNYTPPVLKGVVAAGETTYRAGLVIKGVIDIDNLCTCRASRDDGIICAHSVAVGLHWMRGQAEEASAGKSGKQESRKTGAEAANPVRSTAGGASASPKPARDGIKLRRAEAGDVLEIHVIFPPNLAESLARGRAMLVFEGATSRGRMPLNALVKAGPFRLSPTDAELLDAAELVSGGDTPGMVQLPAADFVELLPKLAGHPRLSVGRTQPFAVSNTPAALPLKATLEANGEITIALRPGGKPPVVFSGGTAAWVLAEVGQAASLPAAPTGAKGIPATTNNSGRLVACPTLAPLALAPQFRGALQNPLRIPRTQVPLFLSQDWPKLSAGGSVEANFRLEDFELKPQPPKFILNLAGGLAQLTGSLQCAYGPRIMTVGVSAAGEGAFMPDPTNPRRYATRDPLAEHNALLRLRNAGFTGPNPQGQWQLVGQERVLAFFAREFPRLEKAWEVSLEERLSHSTQKNLERVTPQFRITPSGEQWFDLEVGYGTAGGERFSAAEIQTLLQGGGRKLKNGKFAIIDSGAVEELQEVILDCAPQQRTGGAGTSYRMSAAQAGFLDSALEEQGFTFAAPPQWKERVRQQTGEATLVCPPLGRLDEVLRPYQKHGVAWMRFLRENGFGGVLADEMGLGKTLQVLAHLEALRNPTTEASSKVGQAASLPAVPTGAKRSGQPATNAERLVANSSFVPLDHTRPIGRSERHLPHWRQDGTTYFVTFRLADSLPAGRLTELGFERKAWMERNPEPRSEAQEEEHHDLFVRRLEGWLDAGHGACWLKRPDAVAIVEESLRHFDGERYALGWFAIMPNHVHALVIPLNGHALAEITHTWKSFTANRINAAVGRTGRLWQDESFDMIVRSSGHLRKVAEYIRDNPKAARLGENDARVGHGSAVGGPIEAGLAASLPAAVASEREGFAPAGAAGRLAACPTLVVCPTTLVFNWAAETAKFTPELRVLVLNGPDRHKEFARIAESDLIITSYALIRRDAERYRELEFDTVVLDEAQHIKNRQTQNAQAVKAIRAQHRLVLTGTPLENSVLDLWSIFDFLMPGYLGSTQDFRERYEVPIAKERDAATIARLAKRVRPFLLRRLKRDVVKELPAKLEQISFCDLTDEQAAVYQQLLAHTRKEVLEAVGEQGLAKSRMLVLTALLRLRQVCCDLRLLNVGQAASLPESSADSTAPFAPPGAAGRLAACPTSGKVQLFGELLDEIVDGGHRVLVFSQFTSMLALLREELEARELTHCYLDGSTNNRGEVVQKFQADESIPVFLISLKAGGVGLNLTGADTVIHFDPWWNPAVEDQATDRAHRIGQTRVVTSYKLITRGTVEEKILTLQRKKREIIEATLTGEEAFTEKLSWDEIQELLS